MIHALWLLLVSTSLCSALTIDEIVERHVRARGGRSALNSVRSLHLLADVSSQYGMEMTVERVIQRGGRMRDVNTYEGKTTIAAVDGERSWVMMMPERQATYHATHSADHFEIFADLDGEFVDWSSKGHTVKYLGVNRIEKSIVHSLSLTDKRGLQRIYHIDTSTYRVHSVVIKCLEHPSELESVRYLNYTSLYGVAFPKGYLIQQGGSVLNMDIRIWKTNALCGDWMFTPEAVSAKSAHPGVLLRSSSQNVGLSTQGTPASASEPPIDDSSMIDQEPTYDDEKLAAAVVYPMPARLNAIEGTVLVAVLIGLDGQIERLAVVESPHPLLSDAAAYAVATLTFTPATQNGTPIRVWKKVPIDFRLQ